MSGLIARHSEDTCNQFKKSVYLSCDVRGEGGGGRIATLYVHYTIFLVMLSNIKLKDLGGGGGGTHPGVSVWTPLGIFGWLR